MFDQIPTIPNHQKRDCFELTFPVIKNYGTQRTRYDRFEIKSKPGNSTFEHHPYLTPRPSPRNTGNAHCHGHGEK